MLELEVGMGFWRAGKMDLNEDLPREGMVKPYILFCRLCSDAMLVMVSCRSESLIRASDSAYAIPCSEEAALV